MVMVGLSRYGLMVNILIPGFTNKQGEVIDSYRTCLSLWTVLPLVGAPNLLQHPQVPCYLPPLLDSTSTFSTAFLSHHGVPEEPWEGISDHAPLPPSLQVIPRVQNVKAWDSRLSLT